MAIKLDKKAIRRDPLLRVCMYAGIPASVLAVFSLWVGQAIGSSLLGLLFLFSTAIAIVAGLVYNVRFVMLSVRELKAQQRASE